MQRKTAGTLTDVEIRGLAANYSLADGHAYQDLESAFTPIVQNLSASWRRAQSSSIPEVEREFLATFARVSSSTAMADRTRFKICPTASNSIDIVGAFLAQKRLRTVLIEPTFDNLALLLLRRGVDLQSIKDIDLVAAAQNDTVEDALAAYKASALFLVNPNNPTGRALTPYQLSSIAEYCVRRGMLLILDNSFRLHNRAGFDDYRLLDETGVSYIAFEDTGKVFPTLDMKASLLLYSDDNADLLEELYNELYLCTSAFSLAVLMQFLCVAEENGLQRTVWDTVDRHRKLLRQTLSKTKLRTCASAVHSMLSVEWIDCSETGMDDISLCKVLETQGLTLLPGRMFYWSSYSDPDNHRRVRISMLKPAEKYVSALHHLANTEILCVSPSDVVIA